MKKLYTNYITNFKDLSREIWWLSILTLINRMGAMVLPFLGLYLEEGLLFNKPAIGWIMTAYGLGSLSGSWLGGFLADKIGYYKTMVISLFLSGIAFWCFSFLSSFTSIIIGTYVLMLIVDAFRPASFVAINAYSNPENRERSVAFLRLAINLGYGIGPAIGGLLIDSTGFLSIFYIDAITCLIAAVILFKMLNPVEVSKEVNDIVIAKDAKSVYSDFKYLIFIISMMLFGVVFLQFLSTLPFYYKEIHGFSKFNIGLLTTLNCFLIVVFEMPLVGWLKRIGTNIVKLIIIGGILTGLSFLVLNFTNWVGVVIIGMVLATFGEMIVFTFSNVFALNRASRGKPGAYMALYSMAFSVSHIIGHNGALQVVYVFGFTTTWYVIFGLSVLCVLLLWRLKHALKQEVRN